MHKICDNSNRMDEVLANFSIFKPHKRQWGNFRITDGDTVLKYVTNSRTQTWDSERGQYVTNADESCNVIAVKTKEGKLLGNASILPLVGQTCAWGNVQENYRQTVIQGLMEKSGKFQMIPFSVMEQADLDMNTLKTHEEGGAETVSRNRDNPKYDKWDAEKAERNGYDYSEPQFLKEDAHFIGSQLFSVSGDKDGETLRKLFLFDIDRVEIVNGIFNPFLVEVPDTTVDTIESAYDSLIPDAVKTAKANGVAVQRQGEWFFVQTDIDPTIPPVDAIVIPKEDLLKRKVFRGMGYSQRESLKELWGEVEYNRIDNLEVPDADMYTATEQSLRAGNNRPNRAKLGVNRDGLHYVMGEISHTGREHKTITLDSWHLAMPNNAIKSFTITGDID